MTVYVDDFRMQARVGRINARWSHLMADSRDELIEFADRLGLRRAWLQDKRSGVHFDVTDSVRVRAISLGAVPIKTESAEHASVRKIARSQHQHGPHCRKDRICQLQLERTQSTTEGTRS